MIDGKFEGGIAKLDDIVVIHGLMTRRCRSHIAENNIDQSTFLGGVLSTLQSTQH